MAYGPSFWLAYVANLTISVAVALLYRYADFVTVLGGSEWHLGWIVGLGMVGSLGMRFWVGAGIDRRGSRWMWLTSLAAFVVTTLAHLALSRYDGPAIYALRILWCCSVAGIYGSATTFIANGVSTPRIAELVGMLGTSGFLGIVLGTLLGDVLSGTALPDRTHVDRMFLAAALLGLAAMAFAWLATRSETPVRRRRHVPLWAVLRRYHPGGVLLMGVASGIGLGLPQTFVRAYALELGIARIGQFFTVYSAAAIITRVLTRHWFARYRLDHLVLFGTATLAGSVLLFLPVRSAWGLLLPGVGFGIAHAILFPSVIAAGSRTFPRRHLGLATTATLASLDVGLLIGAPIAGAALHYSELLGLPTYPTMFASMAALMAAIGGVYLVLEHNPPRRQRRVRERRVTNPVHQRPPIPTFSPAACGESFPTSSAWPPRAS